MTSTRNLIIGCDGTWNDTDETALTNVPRLLQACSSKKQRIHYEEGVGTAYLETLIGGVYGKGLERQILGAYRFLRKRFADKDWEKDANKVFIFGFSRGAYAARRLAGLIAQCGIPSKSRDVDIAWQLYLRRDARSIRELKRAGRLFDISVEMVGVWDSVKTTTDEDFNDNKLPDCVLKGYHAIAIDEKRKFFPVLKWHAESRVTQAWFPGVHSDVGGGYEDSGLADITLKWMIDRAYEHGVKFKAKAVGKLNHDPCAKMHESHTGIWKKFGVKVRAINKTAQVQSVTQERVQKLADYDPGNLPENPNYVA